MPSYKQFIMDLLNKLFIIWKIINYSLIYSNLNNLIFDSIKYKKIKLKRIWKLLDIIDKSICKKVLIRSITSDNNLLFAFLRILNVYIILEKYM